MKITRLHSDMFYVIKACSCLLIVLSHMPFGSDILPEMVRISIGQIGVFVFFVLRPFIAVAVCYLIAKILEWILLKMKWYDRIGSLLALR